MVNFVLFIIWVSNQLLQFRHIFPCFSDIKRPKIHVERLVLKILHRKKIYIVNVKIEGTADIGRGF